MTRALLDQFQLPNIGYVNCGVTIYVADANGLPTAVKATLYDSLTGAGTLFNPQSFGSDGALQQPTYIDAPVVPIVTGAHVASQTLGFVSPPGGARGNYVAGGTLYLPGDIIIDGPAGAGSFDLYAAVNLFASTTWAVDVANAAKLKLLLDVSALNIAPDATTAVKGKAALATSAEFLTGTDNAKIVTSADAAALWAAGTDNAGGATITMGNGGSFNLITSTTAITALAFTTDKAGRKARVRFNTIRTLTYNATSLIIPGAASVTTAVGDTCEVESLGSGNFRVNDYSRADGTPLVGGVIAVAADGRNIVGKNNAVSPNSKFDITADEVVLKDTGGTAKLFSTVSVTVDMAASGANGLDTGAEASGTWYYLWLIGKSDGTIACLASVSATAPTMPGGYTFKALFGAIRNDGSSNFVKTRILGRRHTVANQQVLTGTAATTPSTFQSLDISAAVPPIAKTADVLAGKNNSTSAAFSMAIASDSGGLKYQFTAWGTGTPTQFNSRWFFATPFKDVILETASTIYWTSAESSAYGTIDITGYMI